jgi:hypothetical protein
MILYLFRLNMHILSMLETPGPEVEGLILIIINKNKFPKNFRVQNKCSIAS